MKFRFRVKQTKSLLLLLALLAGQVQAKVEITEIMQSNFGGVLDYYNEFPDSWVEIHNSGDESIDLKGWAISEKNSIDSAYIIPESFVVPADGYFLIFCDDENKKQHTNFKLNSDKPGSVFIWNKSGVLQDSLRYPEMISPEVSFGRLPDNPDSLSHFRVPTPEKANNNTNTERVLKKVDFSVDGGVMQEPFSLILSMKGDIPADAVIRYTTDGREPNNTSTLYQSPISIRDNIVVRAKAFSDSAISKISKTQTYIFNADMKIIEKDNKMPIISITCDNAYLYSNNIGIFSSSDLYASSHGDNPPSREWMGSQNYLYNWRRPINIEYFSRDTLTPDINQLSEARVSGNISRQDADVKSMVVYANKRFGEKHFNGVLWNHLKPGVNKQKSMTIRSYKWDDRTLGLNDMLSQTAIGRVSKFYDVDFQAQRNVMLFINGMYQQVMHIQERDNDDFVWANHNKNTDIEIIETSDGLNLNYSFDAEQFPNYAHFMEVYQSSKSTYQQMADVLDINAFMNMLSTQAYFANNDFPYNNAAMWYDKKGSKKWRWILKDMDATVHDPEYCYYNFILREGVFDDFGWANTPEACEIYQKMFSFEKFKQPYIDRTTVLAGTAFSKNTLDFMLDSLIGDMSYALTIKDLDVYTMGLEHFYDWTDARHKYYSYDLSRFFGLGDTAQLTIRSSQHDSMIYFNNNPLVENKFEGYFFEGRDLYLTHNNNLDIYGINSTDTDEIKYLDLGEMKKTEDSTATRWTVAYNLDGNRVFEHYTNEDLHYKIPTGAEDVYITDDYIDKNFMTVDPSITSRAPEDLTYMVYSVSGMFVGKFNYAEICDYKQQDDINIVNVLDSNGCKLYSFKLLKTDKYLK